MGDTNGHREEQELHELRIHWDKAAASFDDEPDHGLHPPVVLEAWTKFLKDWLPESQADILDLGCGTGSLSVLMAGLGHQVVGVDISPEMITHAEAKARLLGQSIDFQVMDAAHPQLPSQSFQVVVARHVLWTFQDLPQVLARWLALLKPNGRLILIEGYWDTGAGLHAEEVLAALPHKVNVVAVENLSAHSEYWGKRVKDERYAVIADLRE